MASGCVPHRHSLKVLVSVPTWIRDSPSQSLSSWRIPPSPLIPRGPLFWSFWPGRWSSLSISASHAVTVACDWTCLQGEDTRGKDTKLPGLSPHSSQHRGPFAWFLYPEGQIFLSSSYVSACPHCHHVSALPLGLASDREEVKKNT